MKFALMQNPLNQIPFFAWIYNSFIISHLLEWSKVLQIKNGIRVNFDQCVQSLFSSQKNIHNKIKQLSMDNLRWTCEGYFPNSLRPISYFGYTIYECLKTIFVEKQPNAFSHEQGTHRTKKYWWFDQKYPKCSQICQSNFFAKGLGNFSGFKTWKIISKVR